MDSATHVLLKSRSEGTKPPSDCCIVPPMASTPRIVVAYAAVGSGHRMAAEAVARELGKLGGDSVVVGDGGCVAVRVSSSIGRQPDLGVHRRLGSTLRPDLVVEPYRRSRPVPWDAAALVGLSPFQRLPRRDPAFRCGMHACTAGAPRRAGCTSRPTRHGASCRWRPTSASTASGRETASRCSVPRTSAAPRSWTAEATRAVRSR